MACRLHHMISPQLRGLTQTAGPLQSHMQDPGGNLESQPFEIRASCAAVAQSLSLSTEGLKGVGCPMRLPANKLDCTLLCDSRRHQGQADRDATLTEGNLMLASESL